MINGLNVPGGIIHSALTVKINIIAVKMRMRRKTQYPESNLYINNTTCR